MEADGAALVTLLMQPERGLVAVLVEVRDLQPAGGAQPDSRPQKRFQNWAIAGNRPQIATATTINCRAQEFGGRLCRVEFFRFLHPQGRLIAYARFIEP